MTEHDVKGNLLALKGAIETNDSDVAAEVALLLLEGFLVNQVRIAEALEDIRSFGTGQSLPPETK